jgi:uncharacterized protein with ATP-grasp and redox domains
MTISSLNKLALDEDSVKALYTEILAIPALRGLVWNITSAEVIEHVWKKIVKRVKTPDPFHLEKSNQNKKIMEQLPVFEKMIEMSPDPLFMAIKLAILGNSLDLMVADTPLTLKNTITERVNAPLSKEIYSNFRQQLHTSKRVIYFGDNAGEIVFDKLLIEKIKKIVQLEVVFVVRSVPTLNDATLKEARNVGIDQTARVVENGIEGPLPGTLLGRCSDEINDLVRRSDLIISKGGGNFDTLDEERKRLNKNITFMLLSKCAPYYQYFGVELFQPIMANYY